MKKLFEEFHIYRLKGFNFSQAIRVEPEPPNKSKCFQVNNIGNWLNSLQAKRCKNGKW